MPTENFFLSNCLCSETKAEYKPYFIRLPLQAVSAQK